MAVALSAAARRLAARFEDVTGATVRDCLVDAERDFVAVLVAPDDVGDAVGPAGEQVEAFEERIEMDVTIVADAEDPATFVENALAPAAVRHVTISENGDTVAYVEVPRADRGAAIGPDGRNVDAARRLAARNVGVDGIEFV